MLSTLVINWSVVAEAVNAHPQFLFPATISISSEKSLCQGTWANSSTLIRLSAHCCDQQAFLCVRGLNPSWTFFELILLQPTVPNIPSNAFICYSKSLCCYCPETFHMFLYPQDYIFLFPVCLIMALRPVINHYILIRFQNTARILYYPQAISSLPPFI